MRATSVRKKKLTRLVFFSQNQKTTQSADTLEKVRTIISEQLGTDLDAVAADAKFVDLGPFNIVLALLIAGAKAFVVVSFFMALKYDAPVNRLVFGSGLVFVLIFLTFTLFDTAFRDDQAMETVTYPNEQVEAALEAEQGGDDAGTEIVAPVTGDELDNTVGDGDSAIDEGERGRN